MFLTFWTDCGKLLQLASYCYCSHKKKNIFIILTRNKCHFTYVHCAPCFSSAQGTCQIERRGCKHNSRSPDDDRENHRMWKFRLCFYSLFMNKIFINLIGPYTPLHPHWHCSLGLVVSRCHHHLRSDGALHIGSVPEQNQILLVSWKKIKSRLFSQ